jgi:putative transposon-encoded protein
LQSGNFYEKKYVLHSYRRFVVKLSHLSGKKESAMELKETEKIEVTDGTEQPVSKPKDEKTSWVKFELIGVEMVEKDVRASGNSGRIYLPPDWVGCKVKIVKID